MWGRRGGVLFILWGGGNGVWDGCFLSGACVCGGNVWFGIDGVLHVRLSGSRDYIGYEFRDKPARALF